jgi:type I restriction enzyme S subunit
MSHFKDTDIGPLPNEWEISNIGSVADVTKLAGYEYTEYFNYSDNDEIIALRALNVREGVLDLDNVKYISRDVSEALPRSKLFKHDLLFTYIGANIGQFAIVPENDRFHLAPNICRFRCKEDYHYYFLYSYMRSSAFRDSLEGYSHGSSQPTLPMGIIRTIPVPVPPLSEQKAIASVLSSLDDKIDLLHRQNKTLEAMAETMLRQWFIEEAREDWVNVQLKDIVKQIKPGTNYQPKRLDSGIPFLNVRNLQNGQINLQGISFISQEEYERVHKAWKPEEGDVLISRIGTLGIVAVLGKRDMPMAVHYNMLVLKPSLTNTAFLYFLLRSQYFQEAYSSKARQSVQEYVAVEDAESIELKLPLNDAAFANKQDEFYCLFNKIRANLYQIQTLENLRDTLLPKLMSGEVRVQYQTEQVA